MRSRPDRTAPGTRCEHVHELPIEFVGSKDARVISSCPAHVNEDASKQRRLLGCSTSLKF
ncbi:hypothetical protein WN55_07598 [Dufourea novaeangliae]|uniref:Uncharacterized protein n=1 Tax=Dufourea novaeangliae TaxID=178035 RepID=A0A154P2I3_DUFNO|nr:hypothetical protein WN55_07598 [Dufourea novaeangliae]